MINHGGMLAVLAAMQLAACSESGPADGPLSSPQTAGADRPGTPGTTPAPPRPDRPEPVTMSASAPAPPTPARASRYSSLQDCSLEKHTAEGGGYSVRLCPGVGARLRVRESDGRQNVAVAYDGAAEQGLNLPAMIGAGFGTLGPQAEWRGVETPSGFRADALIIRYAVVEDPNQPTRPTSYLAVARISPGASCVTGRIPPGGDQNSAARRLADRPDAPCLTI